MSYSFPNENAVHTATWLIWPHEYTYGRKYKNDIEPIWIEMVRNLIAGEMVHIIAYDDYEQQEIIKTLASQKIDIKRIKFFIGKSNDVWIRDTGPIFVINEKNKLFIADFKFDGWGKKCKARYDDLIPTNISHATGIPILEIPGFVLEGGSIETDGNGTCMATKSSVISRNRNWNLKINDAEQYLAQYLGVTNFIWLEGVLDEDITDAHIDGIARFYDEHTILTVSKNDFYELYESIKIADYHKLMSAKNKNGEKYKVITMPLTARNVKGLNYKGNYLNYYIANSVVLMPSYNDSNDNKAKCLLEALYPNKTVVSIDVTKLYKYGGMIHCITQQQPE